MLRLDITSWLIRLGLSDRLSGAVWLSRVDAQGDMTSSVFFALSDSDQGWNLPSLYIFQMPTNSFLWHFHCLLFTLRQYATITCCHPWSTDGLIQEGILTPLQRCSWHILQPQAGQTKLGKLSSPKPKQITNYWPKHHKSGASSCRATSMDIPDPLSPLLPIVHRLLLNCPYIILCHTKFNNYYIIRLMILHTRILKSSVTYF